MNPHIKYLLILVAFSLFIAACKNNRTAPVADNTLKINIDNSTAEKLLREIWRYSIMADTVFNANKSSIHHKIFSGEFRKSKESTLIDSGYEIFTFNVIINAKIDSIKNITDSSSAIYSKELYYHNKGKYIKIKYDFIKESGNWFIDDLSPLCAVCMGKGKVQDIETEQKHIIECPACKGTGWFSLKHGKPLTGKWGSYAERKSLKLF
ncbi:MAG: hypothetical protein ACM34K_00575 [Bacillota bacterium]